MTRNRRHWLKWIPRHGIEREAPVRVAPIPGFHGGRVGQTRVENSQENALANACATPVFIADDSGQNEVPQPKQQAADITGCWPHRYCSLYATTHYARSRMRSATVVQASHPNANLKGALPPLTALPAHRAESHTGRASAPPTSEARLRMPERFQDTPFSCDEAAAGSRLLDCESLRGNRQTRKGVRNSCGRQQTDYLKSPERILPPTDLLPAAGRPRFPLLNLLLAAQQFLRFRS